MRLIQSLDAAQIRLLQARLDALLSNAPANGLLSITIDLAASDDEWLTADLTQTWTCWWSNPASADRPAIQRLALGCAMVFGTAGPARFPALQAACSGLRTLWQHDDCAQTGALPAAHIGFAFEEETQDEFPNTRLVVPAILLESLDGRRTATFSCAVRDANGALDGWLAQLRAASRPDTTQSLPSQLSRRSAPLSERAFLARSRAALAEIAAGKLDKLVLTRSVKFAASQPIPVAALAATLAHRHSECTIFALGQQGQAFVGATPEGLVSLDNGLVRADALAGTAWLSASQIGQPGSLKLQDDKNSREQQLVVDAVRHALSPLCATLDLPSQPEIMYLRGLQHLRTRVAGRVHPGVGLFELIARLHPTPAVGGTPQTAARHWLRAHGDRRGAWYTGGIGWINRKGDGEIAVALRCAIIKGAEAELFAGAGIVAGSDPAQEFAETEAKLTPMIEALTQASARNQAQDSRTGTR